MKGAERWSTHARDLKPLEPGMKVIIQNQHGAGKTSKKWDRTGLIIDDLGYNKYRVRVDGSGRVTDRTDNFYASLLHLLRYSQVHDLGMNISQSPL